MTAPPTSPTPTRTHPPLFHVVLHEPEIPNNTGNIGRTCVATRCALHLIHPLGFDTSEKACRRAGLDYWPRLAVQHHESFANFHTHFHAAFAQTPAPPIAATRATRPPRIWAFTTHATRCIFDADFHPGDALLFGKETKGLPPDLVAQLAASNSAHAPNTDTALVLPMAADERSLNLATAVCAAVYEGLRQLIARGDIALDANARLI